MLAEFAAFLPSLFPIVGAGFSALFMGIILVILVRALTNTDIRDLFLTSDRTGLSITKFWQNIAYAAGTLAFLAVNISNGGSGSLEIIWVIYLGVIGGNSVLSKWIDAKYSGPTVQQTTPTYGSPYSSRSRIDRFEESVVPAPAKQNVDNPDA